MDKKTILIAGGTGLIGQKLIQMLDPDAYNIHILSRSEKENKGHIKYFVWDINEMKIDPEAVQAEVIINLTGAGIADERWTEERKKVIIKSRVDSADLLLRSITEQKLSPELYLSASAVGYYGDRGEEVLTEESPHGKGFLSKCCVLWETAADDFKGIAQRVVKIRIGVVLSLKGGALPQMLMTRKLGVYTYFGEGDQYYSWIHIDDLIRIFIHVITHSNSGGVYNGVAPNPETNKLLTKSLKDIFGGILMLPAPASVLKLAMGQMSAVILDSSRVIPKRIKAENFTFLYPDLRSALKNLAQNQS